MRIRFLQINYKSNSYLTETYLSHSKFRIIRCKSVKNNRERCPWNLVQLKVKIRGESHVVWVINTILKWCLRFYFTFLYGIGSIEIVLKSAKEISYLIMLACTVSDYEISKHWNTCKFCRGILKIKTDYFVMVCRNLLKLT